MNRKLVVTGGITVLVTLGVLSLVFMSGGDGDSPERSRNLQPAVEEQQSTLQEGRTLYRRYCVTCHGKQGEGAGPAAGHLSTSPMDFHGDTAAQLTDRELFDRISHGKVETGMPAWQSQLSRQQRWAIVDYIRTSFINSEMDSPPLR